MLFLLLYFLKHATDGFPPQLNLLEMHGRSPCPSALPTLWLLLNLRPIASMPHCVTLSTWFLAVHYISQPFQRFVGDGGVLYSLSAISLSKRFILGIFWRGKYRKIETDFLRKLKIKGVLNNIVVVISI